MNNERPESKLRPVAGKEHAFREIGTYLEKIKTYLSRAEREKVQAQIIASMCADEIAETPK